MEAIQLLCSLYYLAGERALYSTFTAKFVSEELNYSIYQSRKLIRTLREYGIINRMGNMYAVSSSGRDVVLAVIKAGKNVK